MSAGAALRSINDNSINDNASGIRGDAGEVCRAADDLSCRTEQKSATLEETAAVLEEITLDGAHGGGRRYTRE
jgi:methyl-accepting chemotaxis protein